ncbi:hypothetical protein GCM10023259_061270 [Thermocatellispora tengchongensis]
MVSLLATFAPAVKVRPSSPRLTVPAAAAWAGPVMNVTPATSKAATDGPVMTRMRKIPLRSRDMEHEDVRRAAGGTPRTIARSFWAPIPGLEGRPVVRPSSGLVKGRGEAQNESVTGR